MWMLNRGDIAASPYRCAVGIPYVVVNGVVDNRANTEATPRCVTRLWRCAVNH
jgi:hypothetical protein